MRLPLSQLVAILSILITVTAPTVGSTRNLPDFTKLVEENAPAVVNISTTQRKPPESHLPEGFKIPEIPDDSPFHDFFRKFFGEGYQEKFDSESLGSGFIISKDGYLITNNHVIRNADEIIVRLSDRREYIATLIGSDEQSDVALLKIEADDLPVVRLGKGYDLKVGEWVLAIGSPFGFDHSVTAGIVSAKGRSLPRENYVPFIQTDVAINPGNSGGPLFNLDGQVVGVNSQIFSRTGGFMGLSFAIPIEVAINVAKQLQETGRVSRGWLGVLIQDVTPELAKSFGMDKPKGAAIAKIIADSPAKKAGLKVGDVILAFNGENINRSGDLPPIVGTTPVGTRVSVKILREGKIKVLNVMTAELPKESNLEFSGETQEKDVTTTIMGLVVKNLTEKQRQELDVLENGVYIANIEKGPFMNAGFEIGDVILMINSTHVIDTEDFAQIANSLARKIPARVLVQRNGIPIFIALSIE